METEVGRLRGVFDDGFLWDKSAALNLFYNFLMPNILTNGGSVKQKLAKRSIIAWATSKEDWSRRVPDFNINTFDSINEEALDILLNTSLGDLNNNRYYEDKDGEQEEQNFDRPNVTRINSKTGETETITLQYGKNLSNKPSLQIETDKQNLYWSLREELKVARINAKRRKEELKDAKEEIREAAEKDLADAISEVEELVKKLDSTRKRAYNDDITLRQVMENDPKVEQFYSVIELSGEGLTDKQKVALGIVREITMTNEARSKAEYEKMYGSSELSYEEFKEIVERKEREYIKMLGMPVVIDNKFAQLSDETIDVKLRMIDLLSDNNLNKRLLDIIREIDYPLSIGENTYDNDSAVIEHIESILADKNRLPQFLEILIKRWYDKYLAPLLNQKAEFTITETTLEKPDLKDRPVRISKENLLNYVTDWEEKRLITDDAINISGDSSATQAKLKINLDFKNKLVSMESAYAAEVGATSTDVINQVKDKRDKSGDIEIDYVINLKGNEDFSNELPILEAQNIFKSVGPILTRYGMRTKTSPDEAAKNSARKFLTRGKFKILVEFATLMKDLKEAEEADLGKSLFDDRTERLLLNFNTNRFFKGDEFKYDYLTFIEKLTNSRTDIGKNIIKEMENLSLLAGFLDIFIEDNMDAIQNFVEEDDEDLSGLSEDDIKERLEERERESMRSIAEEQARQEALEEAELETEQEEAGSTDEEGEGRLIGSMVEDAGEEMEEAEQMENNQKVVEALLSIIDDKDSFDKGALNIPMLKDNIKSAREAAETQINTPSFRKSIKRFAQLLKQILERDEKVSDAFTMDDLERDTDNIIELIRNVEGDSVNEETRIAIKEYKVIITNYWNAILKSKGNKLIDKSKLTALIPSLKLEEGIAEDMQRDKNFNDGRLGSITLSSKKLILSLDYMNRQAQLKGKITWTSKATSTISYKIQGGKAPKYTGALGETPSQKKLRNKYVTYDGREQELSYRSNPVDELRYEFYREVRKNMQILMGVIK